MMSLISWYNFNAKKNLLRHMSFDNWHYSATFLNWHEFYWHRSSKTTHVTLKKIPQKIELTILAIKFCPNFRMLPKNHSCLTCFFPKRFQISFLRIKSKIVFKKNSGWKFFQNSLRKLERCTASTKQERPNMLALHHRWQDWAEPARKQHRNAYENDVILRTDFKVKTSKTFGYMFHVWIIAQIIYLRFVIK